MDRASVLEGIDIQRVARIQDVIEIHVPFRLPSLQRLGFQPGCESLLQPDVIPPLHGDKIAERLMGNLVGNDRTDLLVGVTGSVALIDEKRRIPESDGPGIFHGPSREVRQANEIEFFERILNSEVVVEILDALLTDLQSIVS